MRHVAEFDYVTINDKFDDALADILAIIRSQRLMREAQLAKNTALIASLLK
jgi:guanylate kinase